MRIAFFGTPPFAAHILHYLLKNDVEIAAIVTRTDKPRGRRGTPQPPAVKELALREAPNIPLYQPEKASDPAFVAQLKKHKPDLCVVVAYGEIVKQNLLDLGCINIHASLLPKYRGAAPIQRVIMNGETETGVTIMEMVQKLDAGAILATAKTPIHENTTCGELHDKLCDLSCPLLLSTLDKIARGTATAIPQDDALATYAHKIDQSECRIDWTLPTATLHNLIRGVSPFPGAWCKMDGKRLKILRATPAPHAGTPGHTLPSDTGTWIVATGDGALTLHEVQLEGKRRMSAAELLRGIPTKSLQ